MNGQHHGTSGQQHSHDPDTSPDGATAPTPVTSSTGTAPTTLVSGAYDAGSPAQHAAPGWEYLTQNHLTQDPGIPAHGWGAPKAKPGNGSATQSRTVKRGLAVAGAAVVPAAGAGVGVYALTSGSSSSAAADGTTGAAAGGLVSPDG